MGYLLLSLFLVLYSLVGYIDNKQTFEQETTQAETVTQQRAIDTVRLINAINDYLYDHPDVINGDNPIVLSPGQVGVSVDPAINNVIFRKRVYVWQVPEKGLMNALKTQTLSSALLGEVKHRRLIDNGNVDMGVDVPAQIPEGAIVYLN
ncbi:type IV pilus biogenesis protein PilM [Serratia bockelmannii]|uniref:type IV pilus biogenesis protein PilM n=1 Tax=Serratia bockelmannii TaxID=2703793 RepID=UPI0038C0BA34